MKTIFSLFVLITGFHVHAQSFSYWLSGSAEDVNTAHESGLVLAGGGGDNDDAMRWMLERAAGGDVVVLRASGSDGYNPYFFSDLGVTVDSVETIRFNSPDGAYDPFVLNVIAGAEVLFIAGGDQTDYVEYWADTPVAQLFSTLQHDRKITIGGTSAGMAILGQVYYAPTGPGVTSAEALGDPFHPYISNVVSDAPLFDYSWLEATVTDTHYDQRERRGRHLVFLARAAADLGTRVFGIAANEYTAITITPDGIARVFGEYPQYDDHAYFVQSGCGTGSAAETLQPGLPIDWIRGQSALTVYRVPGTESAAGYFDLENWRVGSGGDWQHWWAEGGVFHERPGSAPPVCSYTGFDKTLVSAFQTSPDLTQSSDAGIRPRLPIHSRRAPHRSDSYPQR